MTSALCDDWVALVRAATLPGRFLFCWMILHILAECFQKQSLNASPCFEGIRSDSLPLFRRRANFELVHFRLVLFYRFFVFYEGLSSFLSEYPHFTIVFSLGQPFSPPRQKSEQKAVSVAVYHGGGHELEEGKKHFHVPALTFRRGACRRCSR